MEPTHFNQLIYIFYGSAMQGMGKLVNPITNKSEIDLPSAQNAIDMLDMIKQKTKGNISSEEEKMLGQILTDLRMNYLETKN